MVHRSRQYPTTNWPPVTSISKKFKNTHSVEVNADLESLEAQFVVLTSIIPQFPVLEDHAANKVHTVKTK